MKFNISAADNHSSYDDKINMDAVRTYAYDRIIEINTIEELVDLIHVLKCEIIINADFEPEITIHNYYME